MNIAMLVADGVVGSGVASMTDVLATAEAIRSQVSPHADPLVVRVLGQRRVVTATNGILLVTDGSLQDLDGTDVAVVPGFGVVDEAAMRRLLAGGALAAVRDAAAVAPDSVAAACAGTFVLADSGRLAGHRVTTTWWLQRLFRTRHPDIDLDVDRMIIRDGAVLTAGAAFAHSDLALSLVGQVSPALAERTAQLLAADRRQSQADYRAIGHLAATDPLVSAFDRHVVDHLAEPLDIATVAAMLGTSSRTLGRRVRLVTGTTPLGLIRQRRVERAVHLQATTSMSTDRIAAEVGYANASTLRALLRQAG